MAERSLRRSCGQWGLRPERSDLLAQAQKTIADDYVNGYLFQLAYPTVADARIEGLWQNAPTQATDLTGVRWTN